MSNKRDYWPATKGHRVSARAKAKGEFRPHLQTEDERDERIEKCYQEYMEVQKRLLKENPTDYDTPAKLKRNLPLTRESFIFMNGGKLEWGRAITDAVKSFIHNDLQSFANEVYNAVVKTNGFGEFHIYKVHPAQRISEEERRQATTLPLRKHPKIIKEELEHLSARVKKIFDRRIYKFCEHMSAEDKETVEELVGGEICHIDYWRQYFNRKEHTPTISFGAAIKQTVVEGYKE